MRCSRCGDPSPESANFCSRCGSALRTDSAEGAEETGLGTPAFTPSGEDTVSWPALIDREMQRKRAARRRSAQATVLTPPPVHPDADATAGPPPTRGADDDATKAPAAPGGQPDETGAIAPIAGKDDDATVAPPAAAAREDDDDATVAPAVAGLRRPPRPPARPSRPAGPPAGPPPAGPQGDTGPLHIGHQFGRYTIIRLLGIGGMGAVYQAWDEELEVPVALKVIRPDTFSDRAAAAEIERRFKRELLLARQVTHRNVVRIHDLGDRDGIKYITMSYVHGVDLAAVLKQEGALPVPRVLRILRGVVSGLLAAHEAGIVHRDLKPANIMVENATDEPLIMDFGIARVATPDVAAVAGGASAFPGLEASFGATGITTNATVAGAIVGTVTYMAPEQARAQEVDQRADLYALGLIVYDLLLGGKRLAGVNAFEDLQRRMETPPADLHALAPEVPAALARMVMRCLAVDPAERWPSTKAFGAALETLDANGTPLPPIKRLTLRHYAVAAMLTLSMVGATYWAARPGPQAPPPEPMSVLVANFEDPTRDPLFRDTVENALATGMEGASFITSYPRQTAARLAQQISPGSGLTPEAANLVAVREGIKVVLAGAIAPAGSGYTVRVRALDPASAKEIAQATATAPSKDRVLAAVAEAAAELRGSLGDTTPESARVAAMETVTAGSLEALAAYNEAQELARNSKLQEALAAYQRAIALDPDFGRAYSGMAVVYDDLKDEARKSAAYEEALKRVDKMTEREKYRTLGTYYLIVARNYEKAIENYETLVKLYPADTAGHGNLGVAYMLTGNPQRAVEEVQQLLKVYPRNQRQRRNLAMYLMYSGQFDEAIREAAAITKESPTFTIGYLPIALSQLAKGDAAGAEATFAQMATLGEVGESLARLGRVDMAMYQGRYTDADRIVTEALGTDLEARNAPALAQDYLAQAQIALALGQRARAMEAARRAVQSSSHEGVLLPAALVLVDTGRYDEARALARQLENMLQVQTTAFARIITAQIALREDRYGDAVEALRDSIKRRDTWFARFLLGRTYAEKERFAEAMGELDSAVKRRGEVTDVFINDTPTLRYLPEAFYWLARSQQAMGVPEARASYETFLALRATAAPPDPLAADARKRLEILGR
jgi:serine/threonine protein kinase/tetratricopeptide (TPR) repeat protein